MQTQLSARILYKNLRSQQLQSSPRCRLLYIATSFTPKHVMNYAVCPTAISKARWSTFRSPTFHVDRCCQESFHRRTRCSYFASEASSYSNYWSSSGGIVRHRASAVSSLEIDDEDANTPYESPSSYLKKTSSGSRNSGLSNRRQLSSLEMELGISLDDVDIPPWEREFDIDEFHGDGGIISALYPLDISDLSFKEEGDAEISDSMHEYSRMDSEETPVRETFPAKAAIKSTMECIAEFDPQNPPSTDNMEDLQIWLECEAQQEAVIRYQKVIDAARNRKDYSVLSAVQKQVVRWFPSLQSEIAKQQRSYILKDGHFTSGKSEGRNKFGPYLCALPPAKLAVMVAHEAIMHILTKSPSGRDGVSFTSLMKRIGDAVEEEVVVHRLLHKRYLAARRRLNKMESSEEAIENLISCDVDDVEVDVNSTPDDDDDDENVDDDSSQDNDDNTDRTAPSLNFSKTDTAHKWAYGTSHLKSFLDEISQSKPSAKKRRVVKYAIRRARRVLDETEQWQVVDKVRLGVTLFQILLDNATVFKDGNNEMAFIYESRWTKHNKSQSFVTLNDGLYKMIVDDKLHTFGVAATRYKPMIIPPKPWTRLDEGGYHILRPELMRYHGCNTQKEVLQHADLSEVFNSLNALGRVAWKINRAILDVAQQCWERNISLGDIPTRTDFEVPREPVAPEFVEGGFQRDSEAGKVHLAEQRRYQNEMAKYHRMRQKNMDLRSLRFSASLKLDQAEKFKDFDHIYFPYNMDFRGRAYPVPPHLSNVGSDLCRGVLMFAEPKALGDRGFYWLKVHLANFAGKDKMTFDGRAAFVDENIDKIRESVRDPFAGDRWWMSFEDPFQGLATCYEIVRAIDSGDPASYMCSLPVHMDGSCNGLQHYAALGRDIIGGKAVNLCATDEPQDVYVGVMHEVIKRVAAEAERHVGFDTSDPSALSPTQRKEFYNNRAAKLVNGLIDRGVVKRTVMTSVYGVTYIGARQQIQEKIESKVCSSLHHSSNVCGLSSHFLFH